MMQPMLACGDSPFSVPAGSPQVPAVCNTIAVPWVSTDLKTWCPRDPGRIASDVQINDRCYRRLDPAYFAWLRTRMHEVKAAFDAGRVQALAFEELRQRFNGIQTCAVELFGEEALLEAVRMLDPRRYRPPMPDEFERPRAVDPGSVRPDLAFERLARAKSLVDVIRDQALSLGWTEESLYFCEGYERRPYAAGYGLACYISDADKIGEVTRGSIEIIGPPPREVRARFYNQAVEQPWIRRAGQNKK